MGNARAGRNGQRTVLSTLNNTQFNGCIYQCGHGPKCRHDHRLKQRPGWKVDQLPDGTFRWTTPAGRSYDTEPTRYPI